MNRRTKLSGSRPSRSELAQVLAGSRKKQPLADPPPSKPAAVTPEALNPEALEPRPPALQRTPSLVPEFDWSRLLDATYLCSADGSQLVTRDVCAAVDIVMVYFTASWCPPCRRFTPVLIELYENQPIRRVEVVLVSRDQDDATAAEYRATMPWLSLLGNGREGADKICELCQVQAIPRLVVLDSRTGEVLSENAVGRCAEFFQR